MANNREMQYANLRKYFQTTVNHVLGDNYYNTGMDVYDCDEIACEDIRNAFDNIRGLRNVLAVLFVISFVFNIIQFLL